MYLAEAVHTIMLRRYLFSMEYTTYHFILASRGEHGAGKADGWRKGNVAYPAAVAVESVTVYPARFCLTGGGGGENWKI